MILQEWHKYGSIYDLADFCMMTKVGLEKNAEGVSSIEHTGFQETCVFWEIFTEKYGYALNLLRLNTAHVFSTLERLFTGEEHTCARICQRWDKLRVQKWTWVTDMRFLKKFPDHIDTDWLETRHNSGPQVDLFYHREKICSRKRRHNERMRHNESFHRKRYTCAKSCQRWDIIRVKKHDSGPKVDLFYHLEKGFAL